MTELDLVRSFFIGASGLLLGLTVAVITVYGRSALRSHHALPIHVALIAASYLIAVIGLDSIALAKLDIISDTAATHFRVYFAMPFVTITGVIALITVLRHTQGRGAEAPDRRRWDDQLRD